jgi:hypothetical protein
VYESWLPLNYPPLDKKFTNALWMSKLSISAQQRDGRQACVHKLDPFSRHFQSGEGLPLEW